METLMNELAVARIVVGVTRRHPESVVAEAAIFAEHFHAELVCAWVDSARYVVGENNDGTVQTMPIDPDLPELGEQQFPPALKQQISDVIAGRGIAWSTRALAGDPSRALGHLAKAIDAAMIVVGTREATFRGSVAGFFNGSVAAHLAHRQRRPVVVVPLNPRPADDDLPWEKK
jgi:nucleotide-binding universal stress UspA family protein